jgi:hypothetical protein
VRERQRAPLSIREPREVFEDRGRPFRCLIRVVLMKVALPLALSTLLQASACQKARDTDGEKPMGPSPAMGRGSNELLGAPSAWHDGGTGAGVADAGHTGPR